MGKRAKRVPQEALETKVLTTITFRPKNGPVADYLSHLQSGARSATIWEWIEEGHLRLPGAMHAKAEALRAEARRLEAEADALNIAAIEERKRLES